MNAVMSGADYLATVPVSFTLIREIADSIDSLIISIVL